jgi:hypothetical protein
MSKKPPRPGVSPLSLAPAQVTTIEAHFLEQQRAHPEATGVLTSLLYDIALSAKIIAHAMTRAGLIDVLGMAGTTNIQDEQVAKLDLLANETLIRFNSFTGRLAGMASEENADIIPVPDDYPSGPYVLLFDPLDGSSNIDYAISVGTIFSIYRRKTEQGPSQPEDFLQPGRDLVPSTPASVSFYFRIPTSRYLITPDSIASIRVMNDIGVPECDNSPTMCKAKLASLTEDYLCATSGPWCLISTATCWPGESSIILPTARTPISATANCVCSTNVLLWPSLPSKPGDTLLMEAKASSTLCQIAFTSARRYSSATAS